MITVGLVVEGAHDDLMLSALLHAEFSKLSDLPIKFRNLQPFRDETGRVADGGWTQVVSWCVRNSGRGLDTYFSPLFENDPACDVIIFHLDGDALELAVPRSSVQIAALPCTIQDSVDSIRLALEEWLNIEQDHRSKIAFAIPVLQTESWIISAEEFIENIEIINSKDLFRSIFDRKEVKNSAEFYSVRSIRARDNVSIIAERCQSYVEFVRSLAGLNLPGAV